MAQGIVSAPVRIKAQDLPALAGRGDSCALQRFVTLGIAFISCPCAARPIIGQVSPVINPNAANLPKRERFVARRFVVAGSKLVMRGGNPRARGVFDGVFHNEAKVFLPALIVK